MTLPARLTISGNGKKYEFHGGTGNIDKASPVVQRFRRPAAPWTGYQTLGSDVQAHDIQVWARFDAGSSGPALWSGVRALIGSAVLVTYLQHIDLRCILMDARRTLFKGCWTEGVRGIRLEATLTFEYAPLTVEET